MQIAVDVSHEIDVPGKPWPAHMTVTLSTDSFLIEHELASTPSAWQDAGILGSTLVTIVGDHGGDTNHGQSSPICIYVPVIAWGAGMVACDTMD